VITAVATFMGELRRMQIRGYKRGIQRIYILWHCECLNVNCWPLARQWSTRWCVISPTVNGVFCDQIRSVFV